MSAKSQNHKKRRGPQNYDDLDGEQLERMLTSTERMLDQHMSNTSFGSVSSFDAFAQGLQIKLDLSKRTATSIVTRALHYGLRQGVVSKVGDDLYRVRTERCPKRCRSRDISECSPRGCGTANARHPAAKKK